MKIKYFLLLVILLISCKSKIIETTSQDYYFINGSIEPSSIKKWKKTDKNTATFNFGYIDGDCCGGLPNPKLMKSKIVGDTIFYTNGSKYIPNCEMRFGTCAINPKFIINIVKYPNYQKLKWKLVNEREFYNLR